ncbi:MAG: hypothetical protein FWC39_13710 [Bacteroidetes bacterium]|nr:hypothetical protein [Bacteroidota bacterium]
MKTSEKLMKILRIVKKVFLWLAVSCVVLIITALILSYVYRDKITDFVTQELLSQVNGEVTVGKIDVSFLQSFPNVSVQLHSVLAKSTDSFAREQFTHNCDTALFAKRLSLGFNIFDFFNQRYIVRHIQLNDAQVFYFTDKAGNHNWDFIKPSADTTAKNYFIDLSEISLHNSELTLHLLPQQLYTHLQNEKLLVEGDFFSDTIRCSIESKLHSKFVELGGTVYARNYDIKLETNIAVSEKEIIIEKLKADLPFVKCKATAKISNAAKNTHIDAQYTLNIPSFKKLQPELPEIVVAEIAKYAIDGKIDLQGWCKGSITEKTLPALEATVSCEKGQMIVEKETLKFSLKTTVKTSDLSNIAHYQLDNALFDAALKNSTANGTVTISNLKNLTADLQAQTTINIADIKAFTKTNFTLDGLLKGSVHYKGNLLDLSNITPAFFTKNTLSAQLQAENLTFVENEKSPFAFSKINGKFNIQGATIQIDEAKGIVQNNDFSINGRAENILPYIVCENQSASFTGNLQLNELNINPFVDYLNAQPTSPVAEPVVTEPCRSIEASKSELAAHMELSAQALQFDKAKISNIKTQLTYKNGLLQLQNLVAQVVQYDKTNLTNVKAQLTYKNDELQLQNLAAQTVQYDKANLTNVKTNLIFKNDALQLPNLTAQTLQYDKHLLKDVKTKLLYENNSLQLLNTSCGFLNGTYEGSAQITFAPDATTHCKVDGSIKNMPIREVMTAFNNFDQTFLQAEQINGIASADFSLQMKLDKNNDVDYSTLQLQSKINVKNGEISNFEPFVAMGKKLKVEEFKNVTFNQIENTLTIKNDTVHIPRMDIRTNAFEMKLSGTHAISSNQFKYFMTLYLKKTLTNMFQKRNKTEDFGDIEQNTDGNIVVPLKLFGTPDKFSIDYDFKTTVSNVKQGVEQQKNEWRTIFSGSNQPTNPDNSTTNSNNSATNANENTPKPPTKKNDPPIKSGFEIEYD